MKIPSRAVKWIFVIIFAAVIPGCAEDAAKEWKKLADNHDYFTLRESLERTSRRSVARSFFIAKVAGDFGRYEEAKAGFANVLSSKVDAKYKMEAHNNLGAIYAREGEYRKGADEFATILREYKNVVSKNDLKGFRETEQMFRSLESVPPTRRDAGSTDELRVEMSKEQVITNRAKINGIAVQFGFDTGANFSICGESVATQLGMREVRSKIKLGTINENSVGARFRVAEMVSIGDAAVHNVVFLVIPDDAMKISGLDGVIGFPVAVAFRRTLVHYGETKAPATAKPVANLAFDGFNPLTFGEFGGKRMLFHVDTGANHTDLYKHFLKLAQSARVHLSGVQTKATTGIAGTATTRIRRLESGEVDLAGRRVQLRDTPVWLDKHSEISGAIDGNLGFDVFEQLGTIVFDFEQMTFSGGQVPAENDRSDTHRPKP